MRVPEFGYTGLYVAKELKFFNSDEISRLFLK